MTASNNSAASTTLAMASQLRLAGGCGGIGA
jgi:hypothetical protein